MKAHPALVYFFAALAQPSITQVLSLADKERNAVFFSAGQTGIIYKYDYGVRQQQLLQGHCNPICCSVVSMNKKWVVTGDAGEDSLIVVWDSHTGVPAQTIFNPHPQGVTALDISSDAVFIAALSAPYQDAMEDCVKQVISLWQWNNAGETPTLATTVPCSQGHSVIRFNPSDVRQVLTNNASKVLFWSWSAELTCYSPRLSRKNFRQQFGNFTVSAFLPTTTQAVTATVDGVVILWDVPSDLSANAPREVVDSNEPIEKVAVKIIRLCEGAINQVVTVGSYFVIAGDDGAVRIFDFLFRLEAWFEDIEAGSITSVSHALDRDVQDHSYNCQPHRQQEQQQSDMTSFVNAMPDMIIGTRKACIVCMEARLFQNIRPEDRRGTIIVQGTADETHGLALHPTDTLALIACSSGIFLWNFDSKVLCIARMFEGSAKPCRAAFDPAGTFLAIGFTCGLVKMLEPMTLEDTGLQFKVSKSDILMLKFSANAEWLAAADASHSVHIWKRGTSVVKGAAAQAAERQGKAAESPTIDPNNGELLVRVPTWTYVGRAASHCKRVTGLDFGNSGEVLTLVSVSEDRNLVQYNLAESSPDTGVKLASALHIEESAVTTACVWHPMLRGDFEERIITANSDFKFKQWNAENKICRRTTLGPTFGGAVNGLVAVVRHDESDELEQYTREGLSGSSQAHCGVQTGVSDLLAYSTRSRVLGLVKLPLDGNPNKLMGFIGHAAEISALVGTSCGRYVFTAGGEDPTVCMWRVRPSVLDAAHAAGGNSNDPFLALLPNEDGQNVYDEIVEYFYYLQLRRQGENSTEKRTRSGTIQIADIPALMRAVGYYPSELEIQNIVAEVRYSEFTTTGEIVEEINLDDFIRLYVNHRPTAPIQLVHIQEALTRVHAKIGDNSAPPGSFSWERLQTLLTTRGDKLSGDEMSLCMTALHCGMSENELVTSEEFVQGVLGFEEVSEDALALEAKQSD